MMRIYEVIYWPEQHCQDEALHVLERGKRVQDNPEFNKVKKVKKVYLYYYDVFIEAEDIWEASKTGQNLIIEAMRKPIWKITTHWIDNQIGLNQRIEIRRAIDEDYSTGHIELGTVYSESNSYEYIWCVYIEEDQSLVHTFELGVEALKEYIR